MQMGEEDRFWLLMGKKKSGEASADELKELESGLISRGLSGYSLEIIDNLWDTRFEEIPHNALSGAPWARIETMINQTASNNTTRIFRLQKWAAAAAVILISVSGFFYFTKGREKNTPNKLSTIITSEFSTAAVSKSKLILPDGTQVWLNSSSHISYAASGFGLQEREVQLTGEAFFDVVKNEKVPFIIHTGTVDIRVKGTAFNVKAYPGDKTMETALVRGLVEITTRQDPDRKILLKPNEKITIALETTNDHNRKEEGPAKTDAVYAITALHKNESDQIAKEVWMQTRLVFDNQPFRELAPKLEEWFNIKIKLEDENIASKRFSGVIEKESLAETLQAMQLSFPFTYQLKQNELDISSK